MTQRDTDQKEVLGGRLQTQDGDAGHLGENRPRCVALVPLQVVFHLIQLGATMGTIGGVPLQQHLVGIRTHQTQVSHLDVYCNRLCNS